MGVGIQVGSITDAIGTPDFLFAFFSTISGNLEQRWGARFPTLLTKLYQGELQQADASDALRELAIVRAELAHLPPGRVIWDIEKRNKQPPWGNDIAPDIKHLGHYFVTSTGRDLISTLQEALEALREDGGIARIVPF